MEECKVSVLKFQTLLLFLRSQIKCLSEWQTGKTLIWFCLVCLGLFWQATSVRYFRPFTIVYKIIQHDKG